MSPIQPTPIPDQRSENTRAARGRPRAASRAELLVRAGDVFDRADPDAARGLSMDTIAVAAGVGKATLFRMFGDRDRLLDALSSTRFASVQAMVADGAPPFDPHTSAADRTTALLDAVLAFKLGNANILRAREAAGRGDLRSERYRWTHALLQLLLRQAAPQADDSDASLEAHVLLAALRIDLLDELLAQGHTVDDVRRASHEHARDFIARGHRRR